jgi:hypothetical protein
MILILSLKEGSPATVHATMSGLSEAENAPVILELTGNHL